MAILDEIQLHRIAMKLRVTLQPSPAWQVNIYTDTLLERSTPTEIEHTIDDTHLQRRISLQIKPSYRRKRLHEQSAHSEKTPHDERLSVN